MLRLTGAFALAVVCLAGTGQSASQQQAIDDLVLKNLDAKGGLEKLKAVTTIKQTGSLSMQGQNASLVIFSKRPNMQRQEITVAGKTIVNGFDGVTAWIINPFVGAIRPIQVTGPQADMIRDQSNFDGPLVDYKNQGISIELVLGTEMMGDQKLIHLRLTSRTQQVSHLYLDAVTFLDAKMQIDTAADEARSAVPGLPRAGRHQGAVPGSHDRQRRPAERDEAGDGRVQRDDRRGGLQDAEGFMTRPPVRRG
jgi:outer membrane lipoprotein-sorting protein